MNKYILSVFVLALLAFVSCKKEAGEGGNSSLTGKIFVRDYNSSFSVLNSSYDGADEDVYIIYGDDISYGNKIKASPDGRFEFKYLRKGDYTIYVYSKDTTRNSFGTLLVYTKAIKVNASINKKKQTVDIGTIIKNN